MTIHLEMDFMTVIHLDETMGLLLQEIMVHFITVVHNLHIPWALSIPWQFIIWPATSKNKKSELMLMRRATASV